VDSTQIDNTNRFSPNTADVETNRVFTSRRMIWMASFALFSLGVFVFSPGVPAAIALAIVFSVICYFDAGHLAANQGLNRLQISAIFGPLLAAVLLWIAVLSGTAFVDAFSISGAPSTVIAASLISLVCFGVLVVTESALTAAVIFATTRNHDGATKTAWSLDQKFAGFFGETR